LPAPRARAICDLTMRICDASPAAARIQSSMVSLF
jgi:hypothetical protein